MNSLLRWGFDRMPRPSKATCVVASSALLLLSVTGLWRSLSPLAALPAFNAPLTRINDCEAAELCLLPGIGPALAARIIADRDEHGPFRTVEELDRVKGIGPTTLERLRPWVTCRG